MDSTEVENKISSIKDENERKVAKFLLKLGFEFVECNLEIGEFKHNLLGEIDLMYKFRDFLFLVEVSKEKGANEKRFAFFTKWADKDILKWIVDKYQLRPKKIIRVYFEMQGKKPDNFASPFLEKMTKKGKMNKVVYSEKYGIFESDLQINSKDVRQEFLKELELSEQNSFKTILKRYFGISKD